MLAPGRSGAPAVGKWSEGDALRLPSELTTALVQVAGLRGVPSLGCRGARTLRLALAAAEGGDAAGGRLRLLSPVTTLPAVCAVGAGATEDWRVAPPASGRLLLRAGVDAGGNLGGGGAWATGLLLEATAEVAPAGATGEEGAEVTLGWAFAPLARFAGAEAGGSGLVPAVLRAELQGGAPGAGCALSEGVPPGAGGGAPAPPAPAAAPVTPLTASGGGWLAGLGKMFGGGGGGGAPPAAALAALSPTAPPAVAFAVLSANGALQKAAAAAATALPFSFLIAVEDLEALAAKK